MTEYFSLFLQTCKEVESRSRPGRALRNLVSRVMQNCKCLVSVIYRLSSTNSKFIHSTTQLYLGEKTLKIVTEESFTSRDNNNKFCISKQTTYK